MSSSKRRKVFSFEDAEAISQENSQLRQQFALQCSQLTDAVEKISTLPTSRQQAILGGLSTRDLSMFLVAAIGLVGIDSLRMALQLIPMGFAGYYQPVAAVLSAIIDQPVSGEAMQIYHTLLKKKLTSFLHRNGTPSSYGEELARVSQVWKKITFTFHLYT